MSLSEGRIGITALGSGSGGNAFVLHCRGYNYLIDAGFSRRELCVRMQMRDIDPASIGAIVISHEHGDHVKGCRIFGDEFDIPAYVPCGAADYLRRRDMLPGQVIEFANDVPFQLPGVKVTPFKVSHDALDPVGFCFESGECKIAVATDLGQLNLLAVHRLRDADILVLESNYDQRMLLESKRKIGLKHRIMGSSGHLDNKHALEALEELLTARTRALLLAHISAECNCRELVADLFRRRLEELRRDDVDCRILEQNEPDAGVWIG